MRDFTRREIVRLSLLQFAVLSRLAPQLAGQSLEQRLHVNKGKLSDGTNWQAFIDAMSRESHKCNTSSITQAAYANRAARLAGELNFADQELATVLSREAARHSSKVGFVDLHKQRDFQISLVTLEQGEIIPHHNHPSMTGVLTCATGSLLIDEFDILNPSEATPEVYLRHVSSAQTLKGQVRTLTAECRNVHSVRATAFSQAIDIFTPPYDDNRTKLTRWYHLQPRPVDITGSVYRATFS